MNRAIKIIFSYEWKFLLRNRFHSLAIIITILIGFYAIFFGHSEISQQWETIKVLQDLQEEEFSQYQNSFTTANRTLVEEQNHDIASKPSFAWYRHGYHTILPPSDHAALAIGQRDMFRYYYRLTGMSLHYQMFEHEIANPVGLLSGNFDLAFVFVYLFPLLIIGFCYPVYAADKENGTLPLLLIMAVPIRKIIFYRFTFYFILTESIGLLLLLAGFVYVGDFFTLSSLSIFLIWLVTLIVYTGFWVAVMFLIVSFLKSSSFNALSGATCWIFLLTIVPAVLNVLISVSHPLDSTELAGLARRTSLENEDNREEALEVISEYLAYHPDLVEGGDMSETDLIGKAYAAFTGLKDINNQKLVDQYNAQVRRRNDLAKKLQWISAPVNAMTIFSGSSQTDLDTFLSFQDDIVNFHRQVTSFYFTRLFNDRPISLSDYESLPVFRVSHRQKTIVDYLPGILVIFFSGFICLLIGLLQLKNKTT